MQNEEAAVWEGREMPKIQVQLLLSHNPLPVVGTVIVRLNDVVRDDHPTSTGTAAYIAVVIVAPPTPLLSSTPSFEISCSSLLCGQANIQQTMRVLCWVIVASALLAVHDLFRPGESETP
jgi:hypothetical protein